MAPKLLSLRVMRLDPVCQQMKYPLVDIDRKNTKYNFLEIQANGIVVNI